MTQRENVRYSDRVLGIRSAATHCPKGHPYSGDNLVINPQGHRSCRECHRRWSAASNAKRRAAT